MNDVGWPAVTVGGAAVVGAVNAALTVRLKVVVTVAPLASVMVTV